MHKREPIPDSRPEISVVVPLFDEERIVGNFIDGWTRP